MSRLDKNVLNCCRHSCEWISMSGLDKNVLTCCRHSCEWISMSGLDKNVLNCLLDIRVNGHQCQG